MIRTILLIAIISGSAYGDEKFECPDDTERHEVTSTGMTKYFCMKELSPNHWAEHGPLLYLKDGKKFMRCMSKDGEVVEDCVFYPQGESSGETE